MILLRPHTLALSVLLLLTLSLGMGVYPAGAIAEASTAEPPSVDKPSPDSGSLKVPAKILELCPPYPGAQVIDAVDSTDVVRVMFKTEDDPVKISGYYKKELTRRGWHLVHERFESGARLVLQKDGLQLGFGAHQQRYEIVTFFLSLISSKNVSQAPAVDLPLESPMRR